MGITSFCAYNLNYVMQKFFSPLVNNRNVLIKLLMTSLRKSHPFV